MLFQGGGLAEQQRLRPTRWTPRPMRPPPRRSACRPRRRRRRRYASAPPFTPSTAPAAPAAPAAFWQLRRAQLCGERRLARSRRAHRARWARWRRTRRRRARTRTPGTRGGGRTRSTRTSSRVSARRAPVGQGRPARRHAHVRAGAIARAEVLPEGGRAAAGAPLRWNPLRSSRRPRRSSSARAAATANRRARASAHAAVAKRRRSTSEPPPSSRRCGPRTCRRQRSTTCRNGAVPESPSKKTRCSERRTALISRMRLGCLRLPLRGAACWSSVPPRRCGLLGLRSRKGGTSCRAGTRPPRFPALPRRSPLATPCGRRSP